MPCVVESFTTKSYEHSCNGQTKGVVVVVGSSDVVSLGIEVVVSGDVDEAVGSTLSAQVHETPASSMIQLLQPTPQSSGPHDKSVVVVGSSEVGDSGDVVLVQEREREVISKLHDTLKRCKFERIHHTSYQGW